MALSQQRREELLEDLRDQQAGVPPRNITSLQSRLLRASGQEARDVPKGFQLTAPERFAAGAGRSIFSTLTGAAGLGERILGGALKTLLPKNVEKALGLEEAPTVFGAGAARPTAAEQLVPEALRTPGEDRAGRAGFITGDIAQFLIPGGAPARAGVKAAQFARGAGQAVQRIARLGGRAGAEGFSALGISALQEGGVTREAGLTGALGAALPLGFAGVGRALRPVGRAAGELGAGFLGITTGAKAPAIKEVFKNPQVVQFMRQAGKDVDSIQDEILDIAETGLRTIRTRRGNEYQKALQAIKADPKQITGVLDGTQGRARNLLNDFDIAISKDGVLDFSGSAIIKGDNVVKKAVDDVLKWDDISATGLDRLKRRLDSFAAQLDSREAAPARKIVTDLASSVRDGLKKNVDGYSEMTAQYAQASQLITEIEKALSIGTNKTRQQSLNKLLSVLRPGKEQSAELAAELQKATGDDLIARIAGTQLAPGVPSGLSGTLLPGIAGGGLVGILINPAAWPGLVLYLASGSPRLVGEAVNILGRAADEITRVGQVSDDVIRVFRQLILESEKERGEGTQDQLNFQRQGPQPTGAFRQEQRREQLGREFVEEGLTQPPTGPGLQPGLSPGLPPEQAQFPPELTA